MSGHRVFVGNLSFTTTWQALKDHMQSASFVPTFANVMGSNGKSKGCGLVEYGSAEEAGAAIAAMNDSTLEGRVLHVREDREERKIGGSNRVNPTRKVQNNEAAKTGPRGESVAGRQVFVGNLPWSATTEDLQDNFTSCGAVLAAEVVTRQDGKSAGFGSVLFETAEGAQEAIAQFNDAEFDGRPMIVKLDKHCK